MTVLWKKKKVPDVYSGRSVCYQREMRCKEKDTPNYVMRGSYATLIGHSVHPKKEMLALLKEKAKPYPKR